METTIRVKCVNQPKAGKKLGTIKTDNDEIIAVEPGLLHAFAPGGSYDIEYDDMVFKTGGGMKKVVRVRGGQQDAAPQTATPPQNRAQSPADARRALEMGVMGYLARFYAGGHAGGVLPPTANELASAARSYILGWEAAFSGGPIYIKPERPNLNPAVGEEFSDEVQF